MFTCFTAGKSYLFMYVSDVSFIHGGAAKVTTIKVYKHNETVFEMLQIQILNPVYCRIR